MGKQDVTGKQTSDGDTSLHKACQARDAWDWKTYEAGAKELRGVGLQMKPKKLKSFGTRRPRDQSRLKSGSSKIRILSRVEEGTV